MNKEIEKAKENIYNAKKFNTSGVTSRWEDIDTIMQYMEQLESILNKVTDKLKEDIEIDKVEWYDGGKLTLKQFKAKNVSRKEYAREILNIIEGEKK